MELIKNTTKWIADFLNYKQGLTSNNDETESHVSIVLTETVPATNAVFSTNNISSIEASQVLLDIIVSKYPSYLDISLESPPGLAGDISVNLATWEHRSLPELRAMTVLNIMSLLSKNRLNGDGKQMSIFQIGIAPSASGKGDHINYTNVLLSTLGFGEFVYSEPRSDKAIYIDLFESGGLVYLVDEVQSLFASMMSKKSSEHSQAMLSLLMKLNTADSVTLPGNLKREMCPDKSTILKPFLGFSGYSTPKELSFIINERNIHSGLLGRFIFYPGTDRRSKKNMTVCSEIDKGIIERCKKLVNETRSVFMSDAAYDALHWIGLLFDQDKYLNHPRVGAIYARAVEQIKRTSYILGAETGVVEVTDILFSLKVFINSLQTFLEFKPVKKPLSIEDEALVVAGKYAKDWVFKSFLANKLTKNRKLFKDMNDAEPKSHYKVIEALIVKGALMEEGLKVKVS